MKKERLRQRTHPPAYDLRTPSQRFFVTQRIRESVHYGAFWTRKTRRMHDGKYRRRRRRLYPIDPGSWTKADDEDAIEAATFAENIRGVDDWLESVAAGLRDQRGHIELSDWKRKFGWEREILIWNSGRMMCRKGSQ
jgi:hypothetical protein